MANNSQRKTKNDNINAFIKNFNEHLEKTNNPHNLKVEKGEKEEGNLIKLSKTDNSQSTVFNLYYLENASQKEIQLKHEDNKIKNKYQQKLINTNNFLFSYRDELNVDIDITNLVYLIVNLESLSNQEKSKGNDFVGSTIINVSELQDSIEALDSEKEMYPTSFSKERYVVTNFENLWNVLEKLKAYNDGLKSKANQTTDNVEQNALEFDASNSSPTLEKEKDSAKPLPYFYQRIIYGAPGTGKSYKLNQDIDNIANFKDESIKDMCVSRTTFHPNYTYGNLIGAYKPWPTDDNGITYKFVPGVLLDLLIKALADPKNNYVLIIEEINRANVSAVFGDFFQLLDRNNDGNSEYKIKTSKELRNYLKQLTSNSSDLSATDNIINLVDECRLHLTQVLGKEFSDIYLPKNFYIWATMNSADQGVQPLDSAFKRRWNFEYIGINEGEREVENVYFTTKNKYNVSWNEFRTQINQALINIGIHEDKLLGPFFISNSILQKAILQDGNKNQSNGGTKDLTEIIKNKVLMYLFEDVVKARRSQLFNADVKTLSQVLEKFDTDVENLFNPEVINIKDCLNIELNQNNDKANEENSNQVGEQTNNKASEQSND